MLIYNVMYVIYSHAGRHACMCIHTPYNCNTTHMSVTTMMHVFAASCICMHIYVYILSYMSFHLTISVYVVHTIMNDLMFYIFTASPTAK